MSNQSFDNEVRQKMSDHESLVPPGTWEAINRRKKRRRYLLLWWIPIAGLIGFGLNVALQKDSPVPDSMYSEQKVKSDAYSKGQGNKDLKKRSPGTEAQTQQNIEKDPPAFEKTDNLTGKDRPTDSFKAINESRSVRQIVREENRYPERVNPYKSEEKISLVKFSIESAGKNSRSKTSSTNENAESLPVKTGDDHVELVEPAKNNNTSPHFSGKVMESSPVSSNSANEQYSSFSIGNRGELSFFQNKLDFTTGNSILNLRLSNDSLVTEATRENLKEIALSRKSQWAIEFGVNGFVPLRKRQHVSSITRTVNEPMHEAEFIANEIKISLQPSMAYFIVVRKKIGKKLSIGAGLQYGVIKETLFLSGTETNKHSQVIQRLENGSGGPILRNDTIVVTTTGSRTIDAINSYRFLDIPLSVHYSMLNNTNLSISLTAGINLGIYSSYNNSIQGKLVPIYSSGIYHERQISFRTEFVTGIRIAKPFFRRAEIFAEPYLRFNPGAYKNTVVNQQSVHQAGVGLGISFKL
jgi:hypothetical protein